MALDSYMGQEASRLAICFNGHTTDHPGCAGCHHAFHVKRAGAVRGGRLVPPMVDGPEDCELCHEARHAEPVSGCPRCEGAFVDNLAAAEKAAEPVRQEIALLKLRSIALSWQATAAAWIGILAGAGWGDWFRSADGSTDFLKEVFWIVGVPVSQWIIRREIRRRERMLPRLSPTGEIVYGAEETDAPG